MMIMVAETWKLAEYRHGHPQYRCQRRTYNRILEAYRRS